MNSSRRALIAITAAPPRVRITAQDALILGCVLAIAVGLRLFRLADVYYWHDEVISTFAARAPALEIFRSITANDTHPPLYHILLHYWGALFGYELLPLRLFSVFLSLLCVPAVWLLGRQLFDARAGLLAAALMTLAPFQIFHGQQARMYPMLTLLVLLATLAFRAAWRQGGVWRWALLGLVAAAGFYTHVYFAFSLLGLNLWALVESLRLRQLDRRRWAGLILAQSAAVLLFSPFLLSMFAITSGVVSNFWISEITPLDWVFALIALLNYGTQAGNSPPVWYLLSVYLPAACVIVGGLAYGVSMLRRVPAERADWSLLLCAILTPCLVATLISLTVRPILVDRSLIGVSGPLFVLLAGAAVRTWPGRLTQLLTVATVFSISIVLFAIYPSGPRPHSLQLPLDSIFAERQPGDMVVVLDWQSFDLLALRYPEAQDVYVSGNPKKTEFWRRRMTFMGWHTPRQVALPEELAAWPGRVWVLRTAYTYPEDWAAMLTRLQTELRLVTSRDMGKSKVLLYERKP